MGIDAIIALAGLIVPPAVDFVKKKFLGSKDTPEATLSSLATTKPEVMPAFVTAQAQMLDAQTKFFNRDVAGTPSQWVVDVRAAIRPVGVIIAFAILGLTMITKDFQVAEGSRYTCELLIASWFGSRLSKD